jgi:hypothetical protein
LFGAHIDNQEAAWMADQPHCWLVLCHSWGIENSVCQSPTDNIHSSEHVFKYLFNIF